MYAVSAYAGVTRHISCNILGHLVAAPFRVGFSEPPNARLAGRETLDGAEALKLTGSHGSREEWEIWVERDSFLLRKLIHRQLFAERDLDRVAEQAGIPAPRALPFAEDSALIYHPQLNPDLEGAEFRFEPPPQP